MELELKVESRIFWSRLSIDLVIVLFFTPHSFLHTSIIFWIIDRNSLVIFVVVSHWTLMGLFVVQSWFSALGGIDQFELEDGYSAELEQRIRQMRDPDEMISWDDLTILYSTVMRALGLDEAQLLTLFPLSLSGTTQRWYASLETSRRRTWEDLAQEFLRQYSFSGDTSVTRRELEFLRQGSDEPVSSFISRWREKAAEMIERPTERDQMSMFLRSLHPRFARHLTGVPFQDFRSLGVGGSSESYGDVCSADFQHRRPGYHPYARSLQIPRSDFPPLQHRHPHSVQQYPSVHPHTVTVRPSFQFQRPQTSIPRHEQSRPHRRRQRTYSDLGMPLDRAFERLRATGFLVPLAPRPPPSTLPPRFRAHEFCAFHQMAGHRTDYCASLRHTIQDLIDSGASTHAVPPPSAYTITFWTPRALIFTGHFDMQTLLVYFGTTLVLDSFSVVTGPRADIDGMMVMIQSTLRLDFFISIVIERSSRSSDAFIAHLTSSTSVTLGASHPRPPTFSSSSIPHPFHGYATDLQFGPPVIQFLRSDFTLVDDGTSRSYAFTVSLDLYCTYHQSVGHHTDRCTALRHAIQDIVDSGTFGHPQSDMFPIPTSAQAMHADAPSPAVPDLIDLGD
ncbi:hypothetical protein CK203_083675 [Vitis vinifera]|uniref:Retrotransposon gag domain-containing protein n=1 Tax=Vitis vinifera TaxID=29760 RepID=A0A438CYG4_VITVI|nr:hypothetical protein CK203_083675 [Vitis vinifera]